MFILSYIIICCTYAVPKKASKVFPEFSIKNEKEIKALYDKLFTKNQQPSYKAFSLCINGFSRESVSHQIDNYKIVTLIDFSKASNKKRLWVLDIKNENILYHSLVAHGKNSGNLYAKKFSNKAGSNMSSLGFYKTAETYNGKHGYSLRLDGLETGTNDNARKRAIVIHGANYVSENFIKNHGRLGRSFGCPALPIDKSKEIINTIKEGSLLFIFYEEPNT